MIRLVIKLRSKVYVEPGSPTALIVFDDEYYIVDPGVDTRRARRIYEFVRDQGYDEGKVVFTHAHPDHIGAANVFSSPTYAHVYESSVAESNVLRETLVYGARASSKLISIRSNDVKITNTFRWEQEFLGPLTIVSLPGHSQGQSGFIVDDIFYVGDAMFGDRLISNVGLPFFPDHREALNTLNVIREYIVDGYRLVISHGPIVKGEKAINLLQENINAILRAKRYILELLQVKPRTVQELTLLATKRYATTVSSELLLLNEVTVKSIISELVDENVVEPMITENGLTWRMVNR